MIRHTLLNTPPKRRIAVIAIPRPQQARLGRVGVIRSGSPASAGPGVAWTTISDETPDSSANFISSVMQAQTQAQLTTPGTLLYTPASVTPAQNVAPYNSWLQPNCGPGSSQPASSQPASTSTTSIVTAAGTPNTRSFLWMTAGLLGVAASLTYLYETAKGRR